MKYEKKNEHRKLVTSYYLLVIVDHLCPVCSSCNCQDRNQCGSPVCSSRKHCRNRHVRKTKGCTSSENRLNTGASADGQTGCEVTLYGYLVHFSISNVISAQGNIHVRIGYIKCQNYIGYSFLALTLYLYC